VISDTADLGSRPIAGCCRLANLTAKCFYIRYPSFLTVSWR